MKKIISIGEDLITNSYFVEVEIDKVLSKVNYNSYAEIEYDINRYENYNNFDVLRDYFKKPTDLKKIMSDLGKKSAAIRKARGFDYKELSIKGVSARKSK